MIRALTKLLLLIYGLSIVGNGSMDLGHTLLHQVRNNIHYHEHSSYHGIRDHKILMQASHQHHVAETETSAPIYSYFLFFERNLNFIFKGDGSVIDVSGGPVTTTHCAYATPLTPPPLPRS